MAAMVLTAAYLSINSVDVSNRTKKIELSVDVDEKDITTFADSGWKVVTGGLKMGQLAITWNNDYADDDLDEDLWALFGTVTTYEVRPSSASVAATNPSYSGSVLVKELKPVAGAVGDVAEQDVTWPVSGAVTRATS